MDGVYVDGGGSFTSVGTPSGCLWSLDAGRGGDTPSPADQLISVGPRETAPAPCVRSVHRRESAELVGPRHLRDREGTGACGPWRSVDGGASVRSGPATRRKVALASPQRYQPTRPLVSRWVGTSVVRGVYMHVHTHRHRLCRMMTSADPHTNATLAVEAMGLFGFQRPWRGGSRPHRPREDRPTYNGDTSISNLALMRWLRRPS